MGSTTFEWPRGAEARDTEALELWLAVHGWEVDPTVFMAGGLGPAVQVQPIGGACQDGEPGLLILPGKPWSTRGTGYGSLPGPPLPPPAEPRRPGPPQSSSSRHAVRAREARISPAGSVMSMPRALPIWSSRRATLLWCRCRRSAARRREPVAQ